MNTGNSATVGRPAKYNTLGEYAGGVFLCSRRSTDPAGGSVRSNVGHERASGYRIIFGSDHHQLVRHEGTGTGVAADVLWRLDALHFAERLLATSNSVSTGVDLGRLCLSCATRLTATEVLERHFVGGGAEPERNYEARPDASSCTTATLDTGDRPRPRHEGSNGRKSVHIKWNHQAPPLKQALYSAVIRFYISNKYRGSFVSF